MELVYSCKSSGILSSGSLDFPHKAPLSRARSWSRFECTSSSDSQISTSSPLSFDSRVRIGSRVFEFSSTFWSSGKRMRAFSRSKCCNPGVNDSISRVSRAAFRFSIAFFDVWFVSLFGGFCAYDLWFSG